MGSENLIPMNERTEEEQREIARQGGIASGEARRNKKLLRDCLEILLEKQMKDKKGNEMTGAEALSAKLFAEAMKGNVKAFEVLRDTAGQKPVEKVVHAEIDPGVIAEVEAAVFGAKNDDKKTSD